jgi:Fe-S cluster biogenesis protein NfuA
LHPVPLEERVRRAIEALGPELRRENADAELVSVDEDVVSVRVNGMAGVVAAVEQAIHAAAPEVMEVRCIGQTISLLGAR